MKTNFFKGVQQASVIEIAFGVFAALVIMNLMSAAFGRVPVVGTLLGSHYAEEHAEEDEEKKKANAEDLENFGGRHKARKAGRKHLKAVKRKAKLQAIKDKYDDKADQEASNDAYDDGSNPNTPDSDDNDENYDEQEEAA